MIDIKYALGIVCAGSFVCAVRSGSAIGGNAGASFPYFFALLLIVFPVIGSTAPGIITAVISNFKMNYSQVWAGCNAHTRSLFRQCTALVVLFAVVSQKLLEVCIMKHDGVSSPVTASPSFEDCCHLIPVGLV